MTFPETPRVVYERNTLEEVKCQIRFPPILAIDASSPVAFHEAMRFEFPFFELKSTIKLPASVNPNLTKIVERDLAMMGTKSYSFISEDRTLTLELSKDCLSLTSRRYERWEAFQKKLEKSLEAFVKVYRPSFFMHTCVRYKNAIRKKPLGLEAEPWSNLLQPWICGFLAKPETEGGVEALQTKCVIRLHEGKVEANFAIGEHQPSKEQAFILESHIFNDDRKELPDVLPRLDALHGQARLFFRWCVKDELHHAMRPRPV